MKYKLGLNRIDCIQNVLDWAGKFNKSSVSSCWCEVGRGAGHNVMSAVGGTSRGHLLASKRDIIYTNKGIPAVTDILPDEVNLIHLRINLATALWPTCSLSDHNVYADQHSLDLHRGETLVILGHHSIQFNSSILTKKLNRMA